MDVFSSITVPVFPELFKFLIDRFLRSQIIRRDVHRWFFERFICPSLSIARVVFFI